MIETELASKQTPASATDREFLKYTFFKVDPQWRRLGEKEREAGKREFPAVYEQASKQILVKSYSLVGIRGDADFMFWSISRNLEDHQDFVSSILSTTLGKYLSVSYSYLALTRKSEYLAGHQHEGQEGVSLGRRPGDTRNTCSSTRLPRNGNGTSFHTNSGE